MGVVEDMLTGTTPEEASRIKVRELAKLTKEEFTRGSYTLRILDGPRVELQDGQPVAIRLLVEVERDGVKLPIDGDLRFINPPIRVRNAEGQIVENLRAALRQMVFDCVELQVRRLGRAERRS